VFHRSPLSTRRWANVVSAGGSRLAIGSAATKAATQGAATKALVADETRPAAENRTVPDCLAELSVLQKRVAPWQRAGKSCSAVGDTQANWDAARSLAVEAQSAAA